MSDLDGELEEEGEGGREGSKLPRGRRNPSRRLRRRPQTASRAEEEGRRRRDSAATVKNEAGG